MIVDDVFLSIGSANMNRRGHFHDGEINAMALPPHMKRDPDNPARGLRCQLWGEQYLGLTPEMGASLSVVESLVETLSHRHIGVVDEELAVSSDAMEMFGVLDLETSFAGCRFAIGIRNANNKRFWLACTVELRVFVCHNLAFRGDYTPALAKHSKRFSLEDALSIGVDRMQRNFDPMRQQVERWRAEQLSAEAAKLTIYGAFIEGDLDVPKHLARRVHELYPETTRGRPLR
jgi:hypothetical protein